MSKETAVDTIAHTELAADPAATLNKVKVYGKEDGGVTQLFAIDSAGVVYQLTPVAAGAGGNLVVWTSAKTWAQVYTEILALTGPVICLVEPGVGGADRTMTAQGGGAPTEIGRVQFWSISQYNGLSPNPVQINVQAGFILGGTDTNGVATLLSRNISWNFQNTAPITALDTPVYLQFEGGVWRYNAVSYIFETDNFKMSLSDFATVNAGGGGPGMVRLTGDNSIVRCRDHAVMSGGEVFVTTTGAKTMQTYTDTTCDLGASWFGAGVDPGFLESQLYLIGPTNDIQFTGTVDDAGVLSDPWT